MLKILANFGTELWLLGEPISGSLGGGRIDFHVADYVELKCPYFAEKYGDE